MGGIIAALFGAAYLLAGIWAANAQPAAVKAGLLSHPLYKFAGLAGYGWLALVVVAVLLGAVAGLRQDYGQLARMVRRRLLRYWWKSPSPSIATAYAT